MSRDNFVVCPAEHSGALDNRIRQWLQNPEKILTPFIKEGMDVMDMGCGSGFFTLEMAHLVGETGHVTAVDLQEGMLTRLKSKFNNHVYQNRIRLHQCQKEEIGLDRPFDFILLFYMVHEVPDKKAFFKEIKRLLKPQGQVLLVEPPIHVSKSRFLSFIDTAKEAGLIHLPGPKVFLSKSAILKGD